MRFNASKITLKFIYVSHMRFFNVAIYLLVLGAVYILTGLVNSGYHMMEDHEIMMNHQLFTEADVRTYFMRVWNESDGRVSKGLNFHLAIFSALFGSQWWLWHALVCCTTVIVLYQFQSLARRLGVSPLLSFLLPFMLVLGSSTELMTRLATIEAVSLLIAGFLLNRIVVGKLGAVTLSLVLLLFFTKESFVLLTPFIVALVHLIAHLQPDFIETVGQKQINRFSAGVGLVCGLFALTFLLTDVGNTEADYVLADGGSVFGNIIRYFEHMSARDWWGKTIFPHLTLFALLAVFSIRQMSGVGRVFLLLGGGTILLQFLLLVSVGFSGRYLTPSLIVLFVMFALMIPKVLPDYFRQVVITGLFSALFMVQGVHSYRTIGEYVESGEAIQRAVEHTLRVCPQDCQVLLIGDPLLNIEMFQALIAYLRLRADEKRTDVHILPTESNIARFMELAEIYDSKSVKRFEQGFRDHYGHRLALRCDPIYHVALGIGEDMDVGIFCEEPVWVLSDFKEGRSWYTFRIAQHRQP